MKQQQRQHHHHYHSHSHSHPSSVPSSTSSSTSSTRTPPLPHVRFEVLVDAVGKLPAQQVVQGNVDVQGGAPHELVAHPPAGAAERR